MTFILISNDDGIHADGLTPLVDAIQSQAQVKVVVPLENCSGASNKLTLDRPLIPKQLPNGYYAVPGTPTDCVYLACQGFFDDEPSFVVSGINRGANLGDDVLYSGTVAAAIEGRFLRKSAIAISLNGHQHYETAAEVARYLFMHWLDFSIPQPCVLNINVPDVPLDNIQGFEVTRLGRRQKAEKVIPHKNPRGEFGYWIGHAGIGIEEPGTDFHAIAHNKVSLTPIGTDMTLHSVLPSMNVLQRHLDQHFQSLHLT